MELETITMDPAEADERLVTYYRHLEGRHSQNIAEEFRDAVAGYEALAAGTPLIHLQDAIRSGGFDDKMRPNLAVARADRKTVAFVWGGDEVADFDCRAPGSSHSSETLLTRVDMGKRHGITYQIGVHRYSETVRGWAIIPMSPPEAIDAIGGGSHLKKHLILWEVEEWADSRIGVMPDRDPLLLRHVAGELYAVVAQWDLTELERQVMTGRRDG